MAVDQATDLFLSLTPDRVLDAVDSAGLTTNPLCYALNSFENRVYEVELVDRTRIISKFYRPGRWTDEQILEEHTFIQDLVAAEIPACPILPFSDGTTLKQQDNIYYSLAERRGGRAPDELTDETVERLGMLVARMHTVGAQKDAPNRLRIDANSYIRDNLAWMKSNGKIPALFEDRYTTAALKIADIAERELEGQTTHRLHGDLHLGNMLFRDGALNVLDFDDMVVGPAVQDMWLALPGRDTWSKRQREVFIEGYERFKDFDRRTLRLIEPLRAMRVVHYTTWLAKRWHDPVFPATWPDFGTEKYWNQETRDLEEQLAIIEKELAAPGSPQAKEEETLSNADLFWDWEG